VVQGFLAHAAIVDHSGPHHILCAPVVPSANFPLEHKVEGKSQTRFFASLIILRAGTERKGQGPWESRPTI
jgi:hypothetical protein